MERETSSEEYHSSSMSVLLQSLRESIPSIEGERERCRPIRSSHWRSHSWVLHGYQHSRSRGERVYSIERDLFSSLQVQARALRPYQGSSEAELSFPANAIITVLRKEAQLWRGKYEGKVRDCEGIWEKRNSSGWLVSSKLRSGDESSCSGQKW